jgi:hypothetical protein
MKSSDVIAITTLVILSLHSSPAVADAPTGLAFLKIGVGGKAAAMGEAAVAVVDDPTAAYWNPAGLAAASQSAAVFTYHRWIQDVSGQYAAGTYRIGRSALTLHYLGTNVGDLERRTNPSANPIGTFDAHDLCAGLSYARNMGNDLLLGVTAKLLWESIDVETSEGWAVDAGIQHRELIPGLSLGAALRNLGSMNELRNEKPSLPASLTVGAAYQLRQIKQPMIIVATDGEFPFDGDPNGHFGMEIRPVKPLALRAGYITGIESRSLTAGFGIDWLNFHLNYGIAPFKEDLGEGHRVSLGMDF